MSAKPLPISEIVANRLCTGCGGCAAASLNQIQIAETRDESHRPRADNIDHIRGFARPAAVCPGQQTMATRGSAKGHDRQLRDAFGPIIAVYEGHACDDEIRHRGSSGGAVTALALAALKMDIASGVLHVKADSADPSRSVATVSRSRSQLLQTAGSRYQPVAVLEPMSRPEVLNHQTMVIGKPCDIEGAERLARANPAISSALAMKVAIFCAGTPSPKGTEKLLEALQPEREHDQQQGTDRPALQELSFRGGGWPGPMKAVWRYSGGQQREATTDYTTGWGAILQRYRQWRCHLCSDHTGEIADISVGDPWHTPQADGSKGRSLIIIRTERGRHFFEKAMAERFLVADRVATETVLKAQPNLMRAKASAWGRSLALRLIGIKAPALRSDGFRLWLRLPIKIKLQSFAGTWKRVWQRKLYHPKNPDWTHSA